MLTVQVKSGDSQANAPKTKKKATGAEKQTKLSTSMLPPSTNISSPMTKSARQKGKGKATLAYSSSEGEEEAYEMHDNGYARDNFVVDDDSFDDDFEVMPTPRSRKRRAPVGAPIAEDPGLVNINVVHRNIISLFEQEGANLAADLQNQHSFRKPIFTRQQLRTMATEWTLNLDEMAEIPGIDRDKVKSFGKKFLPMLKDYHAQYVELYRGRASAQSSQSKPRKVSGHSVVDLVSTDEEDNADDDDDEMEDDEDDGEDSHYFEKGASQGGSQLPPHVQRWNAEMDEMERKSAAAQSQSRSRSASSSRGGAGRFTKGGRKGYRRSFGSQKGRSGNGVKKKAASKRTSTGSARSASSAAGSSSRGGRVGARGGGRSGTQQTLYIEAMPH